MAEKIQVSSELHEAMWFCYYAAENGDNSMGNTQFKLYDRFREWLENNIELED